MNSPMDKGYGVHYTFLGMLQKGAFKVNFFCSAGLFRTLCFANVFLMNNE